VATTSKASPKKVNALKKMGVEILKIKKCKRNQVDLKSLLKKLGERDIVSVMVEGGPEIITSLLKADLVDKMIVFTAPKITGKGLNAIGDLNISQIKAAIKFSSFRTMKKGGDFVFVGTI
jgi:riboflavin biosynthesis pyrimidine reductase